MENNVEIDLNEKAKLELNERKEENGKRLDQFRQMIRDVEGLHCPVHDDNFLMRFLRARKFHLEQSLKLLCQYYSMRRDNPDLFRSITPEALRPSLEKGLQLVLKQRDRKGRQVFIFRAGAWNPQEVNLDQIFQCNYICLEEMTSTKETQINGVTAIVDFDGFTLSQVRHFTPKHAIRMVQVIQGGYPCRFQEFHLVNQPYVFHLVFSVVKPFLNEKIRGRIHLHGSNMNSLHNCIDPEILPDFLGGKNTLWEEGWKSFLQSMLYKNSHYEEMAEEYGFRCPTITSSDSD